MLGDMPIADTGRLVDPFGLFESLRDRDPVALVEGPQGHDFYMITSYKLVEEASTRRWTSSELILP